MGFGFKGGFAAFVDGATKGADRTRAIERQETEDAWVKSQRDATLEKQNEEKQQRREIKADSAPAKVEQGAGGAIKSEAMDNRDVGLPENEALPNGGMSPQAFSVQGKSYGTQVEADAAAKSYDDGRGARVAQRLYQQGRPDAGMALETNQLALDNQKRVQAQHVLDEGAVESARAARTGDGDAFAAAFNKTGKFKIGGTPTVVEEVRDIPYMGKVKTFNYTVDLVGPDGVKVQKKFNSHDLSMQTLKYQELLAHTQKGEASEAKAAYQQGLLDVKNRDSDARMKAADAAELRAANGGGGGGKGGKGPKTPGDQAADAWEFVAKNGEAKFDNVALAEGMRLTQQMVVDGKGKVPPALAAEVAAKVLAKPELVEPGLGEDGNIHGVYRHPTQGEIVINRNIGSAKSAGNFKPEQMTQMTERYLSGLPPADGAQLRGAALGLKPREALLGNLSAKIDEVSQAAADRETDPARRAAVLARAETWKQETAQATNNKLDLIAKYSKPKEDKGGESWWNKSLAAGTKALDAPGGMLPSGYAPPANSVAAQRVAERAQAEARLKASNEARAVQAAADAKVRDEEAQAQAVIFKQNNRQP